MGNALISTMSYFETFLKPSPATFFVTQCFEHIYQPSPHGHLSYWDGDEKWSWHKCDVASITRALVLSNALWSPAIRRINGVDQEKKMWLWPLFARQQQSCKKSLTFLQTRIPRSHLPHFNVFWKYGKIDPLYIKKSIIDLSMIYRTVSRTMA